MSGTVVLTLLSRELANRETHFDLKSVGLNPNKGYTTKDLSTKEVVKRSYDNLISRQVPPHGVVVLEITGEPLPYNVFQYKEKE